MDDNLRQVLEPFAIIGTLIGGFVIFTRTLTDYILKKKMIEKGYVNDDTQAIFKRYPEDNRFASLKWGLIIFFAGLSLIIMEYIPHNPESPLPYGLFTMALSLGFLIYYFVIKKEIIK